jgi:hypothetical protein
VSPQVFVIGFLYYNRYAHKEGAIYTYFIITVRCSVLAELGFITNPQDADKLKSDNGQEHAADAVVNNM